MQRLSLLLCLGLVCAAASQGTVVDPRGARPVVPNTRSEKCATEKEWPFCTDDDWGHKCPSGCRIQGLMDHQDHSLLKKIEKIRSVLEQNQVGHRSADQVTKQTYDFLKEKLILNSGQDDRYYNLAQNLRQRISDMKVKIDRQLRVLAALRDRVTDQVVDMQKLEVDIDIKLRSCKGSCEKYSEYKVDHDTYVALGKQINQLQGQQLQSIHTVRQLGVMQSRPLDQVSSTTVFKSKTGQQPQDVFQEVKSFQLTLQTEGSSFSPATISKVPACARPHIQHGRQQPGLFPHERRCPARSDVPSCSHGDWQVRKCPSGCRLHAVLLQAEMEMDRKLDGFCKNAKTLENTFEEFTAKVVNVYRHHRKALVFQHVLELKFVQDAAELAKNLTLLRQRSWRLQQRMDELNERVQQQVEELWRAEVDVDMKLRACRGSCRVALPFSIDHDTYRTLRGDAAQFDHPRSKQASPPRDIPQIKLRPVLVGPPPSKEYKQIPIVRSELLTQFEDIGQNQLFVEKSENNKPQ